MNDHPIRRGAFERLDPMVNQRDMHRCDGQCICPIHKTQLFYAPQDDIHACQDPACVHAHGMLSPGEAGTDG